MKFLINLLLSFQNRRLIYVNCYAHSPTSLAFHGHLTKVAALSAAGGCPPTTLVFKAKAFVEIL